MRKLLLMVPVLLLGAVPALPQDEGEHPPVILALEFYISRYTASGWGPIVPFDPQSEVGRELDMVWIVVYFSDPDLVEAETDDEGNTTYTRGDEEFYTRKQSEWWYDPPLPPEPEPLFDDTRDFRAPRDLIIDPLPADTGSYYFVFYVPELTGPSQARLRDPVGHPYDVGWRITIELSNEEEPGPETQVAVVQTFFFGVENPILRPPNPPSFADAGPDRTVGTGSTVILDASDSFDFTNVGFDPDDPDVFEKDSLTYDWDWVSGPERVDPVPTDHKAKARVTLNTNGVYIYRVYVSDGINPLPGSDDVTITVVDPSELPENSLPPRAAIAGPTTSVLVGQIITLDGGGSADPDGDPLTYRWQQTNELGGGLTFDELAKAFQPLSGLTAVRSTWKAISPGTFYFRLLVSDPFGNTDSAFTAVTVISAEAFAGQLNRRDIPRSRAPAAEEAPVDAPAGPAGCGGGLLPLALVPVALRLARGRFR